MRKTLILISLLGLTACGGRLGGEPRLVNDEPQLRIGGSYRSGDDPCKRVGNTTFTERFVRADEDLVGCPVDYEGRAGFIQATGAREATRTEEWVLYSVPLFGAAPVSNLPATPPTTGGGSGIAVTGPNAAAAVTGG